jgi:hypothetical protein
MGREKIKEQKKANEKGKKNVLKRKPPSPLWEDWVENCIRSFLPIRQEGKATGALVWKGSWIVEGARKGTPLANFPAKFPNPTPCPSLS